MTRKDFEAIAEVLASQEVPAGARFFGTNAARAYARGMESARIEIGRAVADLLEQSNERFDRARFYAAARLETIVNVP